MSARRIPPGPAETINSGPFRTVSTASPVPGTGLTVRDVSGSSQKIVQLERQLVPDRLHIP
jgi:hypothetical protein